MTNSSNNLKRFQDEKTTNVVSIIIVSWNGLHWLQKSIPSLKTVTYSSVEIIVVDNSSTDGTVTWIQKNYPQVKIITVKNNLGFAEANNIGFQAAKGRYVLFLNNDVVVTPTFITELIRAVEVDKTIAGAQSKILLMDKKTTYDSIGAFFTSTGFLYHYCFMNTADQKYDHQIDLFTPKGACMLFKRETLETVAVDGKLFDPDAFAYFEETDMAHRIWLSGLRIVYAPKSVIYHKMGGTSTTMDNSFIQYHSFKNRIASYIKNLEVSSVVQILVPHLFFCEIYALVYLLRKKTSVSIAIQKAIYWNVIHISKTLQKRVYIQKKIRKISDKTYFKFVYKDPPVNYYLAQATGKPFVEKSVL